MPPSDDKSYIDELKKSLYSRTAPDVRTRRKLRFADTASDVQTNWERPPEEAKVPVELNKEYKDSRMSFFTKLFIISALFCIAAVGVGAYIFFNGANLISADNIEINISGPVSIPGGEPVSFDVTVINRNNVDLQLVDMAVDFPAGTTDPANTSQVLQNYRKLIGNIPIGSSAHETVKAVIFGEENLQKEIAVTITYGIKGSTVPFTKKQTYDVLINSSPINMTVTSFKEITSGQEFDTKVVIKSNSQQVLKNVLLKADYPFGYTFISSSIPSLSNNSTWKIGDMPPAGTKTLTIHGKLAGEDTDLRAFHFTVGAQSSSDPKVIGTEYMAVENDLTIQKPFISAGITIGNDQSLDDHVSQFGASERVTIDWLNNLPTSVSNVQITAKLSGTAYDKSMVQPDAGVFDSASGEITWNQRTSSDLQTVAAGQKGRVSFSVTPVDLGTAGSPVVNPNWSVSVSLTGNRTQESGVPEMLSSVVTRNSRIHSNISLSGRIVRSVGPFANTGPIPPTSERATTYTVIWDVDNTSNAVSGAQVTAKLPPYVKWTKAFSPSTENITYDSNTGLVTWAVGNVGTYTLNSSSRREAVFQISFTPAANQIGDSAVIIGEANLVGTDSYSGIQLTSRQENLTTRFSTDPAYKEGDQKVVK